MSKIINTILLSTALILCNQGYTSTIVYDPIRDLLPNGKTISDCKVYKPTTKTDSNYGKVYYGSESNQQYLVDNEGDFFVDYECCVTDGVDDHDKEPWLTYYADKINLILMDNTHNQTKVVPNTKAIKSIIIPAGHTLESGASGSVTLDSGLNSSVLCLGTFKQRVDNVFLILQQSGYGYTNFIFGPKAVLDSSSNSPVINNGPIALQQCYSTAAASGNPDITVSIQNLKFLFYPGSEISNRATSGSDSTPAVEVIPQSQLILNRYVQKDEHLYSKINANANIIFPKTMSKNDITLGNTGTPTTMDSFFAKLKWINSDGNPSSPSAIRTPNKPLEGIGAGQCSFKDLDLQLSYNEKDGKYILGLDPKNEFAKYDVALWDQCKIDNPNYGLVKYNTEENKNNYIDIDKLDKLFYGIPYDFSDVTLTNVNTIYPGLLGSNNIKLDLSSASGETGSKIYFYGDNSNYTGTITIEQNESNPVTDIYYGPNSIINNIKLKGAKKHEFKNNVTHHLLGSNSLEQNTIDLSKLRKPHIWLKLDNITEEPQGGKLTIIDSNKTNNSIYFMQPDYSKYSGKITIPENITDVYINSGDLFSKIKHNKHDDLSGLTFHLMRNVTADIKDISRFDMNLNNELVYHGYEFIDNDDYNNTDMNNGVTNIRLTNNSNVNINTIEFRGNNTNYKHISGTKNKGFVFIPSCIDRVIFKDSDSFVMLMRKKLLKVSIENNIVSTKEDAGLNVEVESGNTYNKDSNIIFTHDTDNSSDLDNILDYNTSEYTWDTDSMLNIKYKNNYLLSELKLNMIFANLSGSADINLKTNAPMVNIMGNNIKYKGKIILPSNVKEVLYRNLNSKVKLSSTNKLVSSFMNNDYSADQDNDQDEDYEILHAQNKMKLKTGTKKYITKEEHTGKSALEEKITKQSKTDENDNQNMSNTLRSKGQKQNMNTKYDESSDDEEQSQQLKDGDKVE